MEGLHFQSRSWAAMLHGFVTVVYNRDPEPRGTSESFSTSMVLFQAARPLGKGRFGFRFMASMEPAMGPSGYPLLLQTGETADGTLPLIDRQHPHDMGFVGGNKMKLEGSVFTGREPNEDRWGLESPTFDSYSGRVTLNPTEDLSIQVSLAQLNEPEILHQNLDVVRFTASAIYNRNLNEGNWQTTVAWGQNKRDGFFRPLEAVGQQPAPVTTHVHYGAAGTITPTVVQHAFLAESALTLYSRHNLLGRFEMAQSSSPPSTDGTARATSSISSAPNTWPAASGSRPASTGCPRILPSSTGKTPNRTISLRVLNLSNEKA